MSSPLGSLILHAWLQYKPLLTLAYVPTNSSISFAAGLLPTPFKYGPAGYRTPSLAARTQPGLRVLLLGATSSKKHTSHKCKLLKKRAVSRLFAAASLSGSILLAPHRSWSFTTVLTLTPRKSRPQVVCHVPVHCQGSKKLDMALWHGATTAAQQIFKGLCFL